MGSCTDMDQVIDQQDNAFFNRKPVDERQALALERLATATEQLMAMMRSLPVGKIEVSAEFASEVARLGGDEFDIGNRGESK